MRWKVQLTGERFDLEDLPRLLDEPELEVRQDGERFFLCSSRFSTLETVADVRSLAGTVLKMLNGALRVSNHNYRPVGLGPVHELKPDGTKQVTVGVSETLHVRGKVTVTKKDADGNVVEGRPDPLLPVGIQEGMRDPMVGEVLAFVGSSDLDWADLYKVVEMITERLGKPPYSLGWVSRGWLDRFTQTANSMEALGFEARHATSRPPAPSNPPTLHEARTQILNMVRQWVEHIVGNN